MYNIARSETDVEAVFETHRCCTLYSRLGTRHYLGAIPDLHITADFSHLTVMPGGDMKSNASITPDENGMMAIVPEPEKDAMMDIAIERTHDNHARVGDLHRPHCLNPRRGTGYPWTELYECWWDSIIETQLAAGHKFITVCPEYGPLLRAGGTGYR